MIDRLKCWLKVKTAPDIGFQTAFRLFERFGDPSFWQNDTVKQALNERIIDPDAAEYLLSEQDPKGFGAVVKYLERFDIKYTTCLDEDYPALLKSIYAPPIILYYRGDLAEAQQEWNFAVVGTRKPTEYGKSMTEAIVEPVAKRGITIVSGLAYGIDTVSHRTAIKAGGKTIAVMAHGLETIYPPQNRELAENILHKGALVSEYEPGTKMEKWNFPARNRIISGLAHGVLIVEGQITSGALLTAKFALEQNRDVYALPGQINIPNAQGPNHLIKNGAKLVTTADDILQDFGFELKSPQQMDIFPELSENEQTVYNIYKLEQREIGFDEIILKTGFSIGQLSIILLNLELKGLLYKTHGNAFALK